MSFLNRKEKVEPTQEAKPIVQEEAPEIPVYGEESENSEVEKLEQEAEELEQKAQLLREKLQPKTKELPEMPIPDQIAESMPETSSIQEPEEVQEPEQVEKQGIQQDSEADTGLTEEMINESFMNHEQRLQKLEAALFRLKNF